MDTMSIALVPAVYNETVQAVIFKSMVPDPEQFNSDQMKFEDWQREIYLFLKNNRVIITDDKIIVVVA